MVGGAYRYTHTILAVLGKRQSEADILLIQEQGGSLQGTSMSPWQYMLAFQQQGDEAASIPASLPSLTLGNHEPSYFSQSTSLDESVEGWDIYTRSSEASTSLREGMDMEGDTVATTSSSLSSIRVREVFVTFGDGGLKISPSQNRMTRRIVGPRLLPPWKSTRRSSRR